MTCNSSTIFVVIAKLNDDVRINLFQILCKFFKIGRRNVEWITGLKHDTPSCRRNIIHAASSELLLTAYGAAEHLQLRGPAGLVS